jgi:GDPmannose 4,6-dehydratase
MKTALITGVAGQDGAYLAKLLLKKNYKVIGLDRRSSRDDRWRLDYLGIKNKIIIEYADLTEINSIYRIFKKYKINEVYNLGAQSFVASSFLTPITTCDTNSLGTLRILEIIKDLNKNIKFYQASSSEMYGKVFKKKKQNEATPFNPVSPYAVSKLFSYYITKNYREAYGIFACNGILFNHESPLRGEEFVTKKITSTLAKIALGKSKCLFLGNIYTERDWGYAEDYVEAIWKILQQKRAEDFVISTGKTYSVKEFAVIAGTFFGIEIIWKGKGYKEIGIDKKTKKVIIRIDKNLYRPSEVSYLIGDPEKANKNLKWKSKTNLFNLIKIMCEYELSRHK